MCAGFPVCKGYFCLNEVCMKFDPLVKVVENKLVRISDNFPISLENLNIVSVSEIEKGSSVVKGSVSAILCPWSKVQMEDGSYNEELLAKLRDYLKIMEENRDFAFIVPQGETSFSDVDRADVFLKSMVHTARRIKDCTSVLGFALPAEFLEKDAGLKPEEYSWAGWFINEMSVKHAHYVYFAGKSLVKKYGLISNEITNTLVLY